MAKGNDGNFMQHGVEVAAAHALVKHDTERKLHIVLTHGMAPYEPLECPKPYQQWRLLDEALRASSRPPSPSDAKLIEAYREAGASRSCYPNSAELLRACVGTKRLSGGITECDREKFGALAKAWAGTLVRTSCASWRDQLEKEQVLACPAGLDVPWLLAMDPMTYSERGSKGNNLNLDDLQRLGYALAKYVESEQPGIAAIFVYAVHKDTQPKFWRFMDQLAGAVNAEYHAYSLAHQGGNRNLAAVLYSGFKLDRNFAPKELVCEQEKPLRTQSSRDSGSSLERDTFAPVTAVVLAAGQGRRMNSTRPKVLQPLAGRPMLAHVLDTAESLEPDALNIVHGHGGEAVRAEFADRDLDWTHQAEQLGTGHAVAQALQGIADGHRVLVLCGDMPLISIASLERLIKQTDGLALGLLTATVDDPSGYGRVLRDETGAVVAVVEDADATLDELAVNEVNTGIMVLPASSAKRWLDRLDDSNSQGEFYLTDVISMAVAEDVPVVGVPVGDPAEALGINDRNQLALAERAFQQRNARDLLDRGVTLADPSRFDLRGRLAVGQDVFIDVGAVFSGNVTLGDRVRIGPNAVVSDSWLGDDCTVHANCVIDGVIAGAGCEIGPFSRLRPGTEFDECVKVGNFVEVKAGRLETGVKVNHLSYVGDTRIGRDSNVGAGTVTCNYDGANKHRTEIGDRVFVGSGSMLVAPLRVGDGATIAAGSTITRDVPPGTLAVARQRQSAVKGWKRPKKRES